MPSIHAPRSDPDATARALWILGRMGRMMPPSWDGAGMSIPVCSPGGGSMGRILPGRGLYLADDLKNIGVKRAVPHVFERSPVAFLTDFLRDASYEKAEGAWRAAQRRHRAKLPRDHRGLPIFVRDPERGAITSLDDIITARGNGKAEDRQINKTSITTVIGAWSSLFRAGGIPVAGAYTNIPVGTAPTRATTGAWSFGLSNPTAPDKKYLLSFGFSAQTIIQMLMLYDLLIEAGNIPVSTTGTKTISTTALTRYTTGAGVMSTFVVTTALGTGVGAMNLLSYTDQDGNTGAVGQSFQTAASTIVERTLPNSGTFNGTWVPYAAGDYGARAISTLNVGTAHTAGVIALEMVMPLMVVPGIVANVWTEYPPDLVSQASGLAELAQTSGNVIGCLSAYILAGATSTGVITGNFKTIAG